MSQQSLFPKITVLGVEFDNVSISQAIEHLIKRAGQTKKQPIYIVKPHIEQIEAATKDRAVKNILNQAYLSLPDGVSLNWAAYFNLKTRGRLVDLMTSSAKIIFQPLELHLVMPNHAWATNFTWSLLEACAQHRVSVFLVGSPRKGTDIADTKRFLASRIPRLKIVGTCAGRDPQTGIFSPDLKTRLIKQLKSTRPDLVLVGLGFPRQEKLIAELSAELNHGIFIAEGGTFDYQSFGGKVKKAPAYMQARGLEWFWRLLIEPYRLKRQLAIPRFMWKVYRNRKPSL